MNTFELFPLPDAARRALHDAALPVEGVEGLGIVEGLPQEQQALLTPSILCLVRDLVRRERELSPNLEGLMRVRQEKQDQVYDNLLHNRPAMTFPAETKHIRDGAWRSETLRPPNMADRACENTHPSRAANMAIHGLNSVAASDFMDNEDSQSPIKASVFAGYKVIHDAVVGTIVDDRPNSKTVLKGRLRAADLEAVVGDSQTAKAVFEVLQGLGCLNSHGRVTDVFTRDDFTLDPKGQLPQGVDHAKLEAFLRSRRPSTIQVRVRGLHLFEGHVLVDGQPVPGSLLDFAVFVATCHKHLAEIGAQPTLYLPKMEGRHETEWWSKIFAIFPEMLGIDPMVIRSTTMIETITASMEKDEMNYTLRKHSLGQNKGRYDYLFNFIKRLTLPKSKQVALLKRVVETGDKSLVDAARQFILPDNAHTTMGTAFLEAYSNHTSQVNLKRGFDSVGGMVTNIPTGDAEIDGRAKAKIRVDKTNEAWKGDAGGWSGHPAFSGAVREPFDIVRGIHKGFKVIVAKRGKDVLIAAIKEVSLPASGQSGDGHGGDAQEIFKSVLSLAQEVREQTSSSQELQALEGLGTALEKCLTLHVAQMPEVFKDGLLRFIDLQPPQPNVEDSELINVPPDQHEPSKFTYGGLKQYLRLALYYTASFIHGTGCIALDGVFEDLATAEKARCNVWQWLTMDQEIMMPDGSRALMNRKLLDQAFDEVYSVAMSTERGSWGRVCKSLAPMQPDQLNEKHFAVARRVLDILVTNDRCIEFIPDLAYPFLLEPVRHNDDLWRQLFDGLEAYRDPMDKYDAELVSLRQKLA